MATLDFATKPLVLFRTDSGKRKSSLIYKYIGMHFPLGRSREQVMRTNSSKKKKRSQHM